MTIGSPVGLPIVIIVYRSLFDDVHLIDEAFATAEFINYEEYVADIYVDATL